jgi:hypothetical protein
MQEKQEEQTKDEEVIIPFHYEAEIVKANASLKGHKFIQRGVWLHCQSCQNQHGVYIGTKLMLVGYTEDGMPKLVARR